MGMWPHLVGNLALLQAVLGQLRIGGLDGARDVIGGAREVVRRSHQRAERRHHEILDVGIEAFQLADQLPRDQQRQRMQRIGDRADRLLTPPTLPPTSPQPDATLRTTATLPPTA